MVDEIKSETTVGDNISKEDGEWNFDKEVTENFDNHVRKSIPNYELIQEQVKKLSNWYITPNRETTYYDLGCSTGTTIKKIYDFYNWEKQPNIIGIDEVRPMLNKAEEKLEGYDGVKLTQQDLIENPQFQKCDLVTSLFTLSFIPEDKRQELLNSIYNSLKEGGALIFCEKTYPRLGRYQSIFREHYWEYKNKSFNKEEIVDKAKSLRGQLRPITKKEYKEMLKKAGFKTENIQTFYQYYMWWGVIARK